VILLLLLNTAIVEQQVSDSIKVNQVGYLTNSVKYAYVSADQPLTIGTWHLYDIDRNVVAFSGFGSIKDLDDIPTEEYVYQLEFSDYDVLGNYYRSIDSIGRSHDFLISSTTYNEVFRKIMKGFYFQRSGVKLATDHAMQWERPAEYDDDAFVYNGYDGVNVLFGYQVNTLGG